MAVALFALVVFVERFTSVGSELGSEPVATASAVVADDFHPLATTARFDLSLLAVAGITGSLLAVVATRSPWRVQGWDQVTRPCSCVVLSGVGLRAPPLSTSR